MAFPTTGVLDDFNRANEGPPPSANWTSGLIGFGGTDGLKVASNVLAGNSSANNDGYWDVEQFGPDCEAHMKIHQVLADAGAYQEVWIRARDIGAPSTDAYCVRARFANPLSGSHIILLKVADNVYSSLGAGQVILTLAAGDYFGISAEGSTLKSWHKPAAGSWTELDSTVDTTYTGAGYIGALLRGSNTHRGDDFGGGTILATARDPDVSTLPRRGMSMVA